MESCELPATNQIGTEKSAKNSSAEILSREEVSNHTNTNTNTTSNSNSNSTTWKKVAEGLVEFRSKNLENNASHIKRIFAENAAFLAPILAICPKVEILLANVLTNAAS